MKKSKKQVSSRAERVDLNEENQESVNSQNVRVFSIVFPDEKETSEDDSGEEGEHMPNVTVIKSLIAEYCKQMSQPSTSGTYSQTLDEESIQVRASKISACSKENSNKVHIDPNPSKPELTITPNTSASSAFDVMVGSVNSSVSMYNDYINLAFKFPIELFSRISLAVQKNQQELASGPKEQETRDSNKELHPRESIDIQELNALRQEIAQKTNGVSLEEVSNRTSMLNESVNAVVQETETSETQKSVVAKRISLENTSDLRSHDSDKVQDSVLPINAENAEIVPTGTEEANKSAFENVENDISRAAVSKIQIVHTESDKRAKLPEVVDVVQLESSYSNGKFPQKTSNVVDGELHKNSDSQSTCEGSAISKEVDNGSANISSGDIIPSLEEIEKRNETEITSSGCTTSRTESMTTDKAKMQTSGDNSESLELTHSENILEKSDCQESNVWSLTEMDIEVEKVPTKEIKSEMSDNIITKYFELKLGEETVIVKVESQTSQVENIVIDAVKYKTTEIWSILESKLNEMNYTQKGKINSITCESDSSKKTEFETSVNIIKSSGVGVNDSVLNEYVNNTILKKTKCIQELQHESAKNTSDSLSLEELIHKEVDRVHRERCVQNMSESFRGVLVQSQNFALVETTQKPDLIEKDINILKTEIPEDESLELSEIEIIQESSDGLTMSEAHQDVQQPGNDESDMFFEVTDSDVMKVLSEPVLDAKSGQMIPFTQAVAEIVQEVNELSANKNLSAGLSPEEKILNVSKDSEKAVKDDERTLELTECGFDQSLSHKTAEHAMNIMHDLEDSTTSKKPKQNLAEMDRAVASQESTQSEIVGEFHEFTENESSQTSHKASGSLTTEEFPIKVTESETVKVQSVDSTVSEMNQKSSQELAESKTVTKQPELTQSEPQQKALQKPPGSSIKVEFSNKEKGNKMASEQSSELNLKSSPKLTEDKPDQISRQNSAESNPTIVVPRRSAENDQKQLSPESAKETSKNELLAENESCRKLSQESVKNQAMEPSYETKEEESNNGKSPVLKSPENDDLEVLNESGQQVEISRSMTLNESAIEFPLSEKDEDEQLESSYLNDKFLQTSHVADDDELHKISDSQTTCENAAISKVEHGFVNLSSVVDIESSHNKMNTEEADVSLKDAIDSNSKELSENNLEGKPAMLTLDTEVAEFVETSQTKVESISEDLVPKRKLSGDTVDNKDINGNNISKSKSDFTLIKTASEPEIPLDLDEKLSKDRDEMLIEKTSVQETKDSSKLVSKSATESDTSLSREAAGAENEGSRDDSSDVPHTDENVSTNESSSKTEIEGGDVKESRKGKCEEQEDLQKKTATPSESTDDIDAAPKRIRNISTPPLAKSVIPENLPVTQDETGGSKRTDQSDDESTKSTSPTKRSLRSKSQGSNLPIIGSKTATNTRRLSEESQMVTKSSESTDSAARRRRAATPDPKLKERMTVAKSSPRRPTRPGISQTESSNTPKKPNIRSNQGASETKSAKSSSASTAGSGVTTRKTKRGTKEKD